MNKNKFAVFGIAHCENKVLMVLRSKDHTWGFPGGMVEEGEDLTKALKRETLEEIGIDTTGRLTKVYPPIHVKDDLHSIAFSFRVTNEYFNEAINKFTENSATHVNEVSAIAVFNVEDLQKGDIPLAKTVSEELKQVFG